MRLFKARGKLLVLAMLGASLGVGLLDGGMALAAGAPGGTPFSVGVYPDPVVLLQSVSPSPPPGPPTPPSPSVLPCQVSIDPAQGQGQVSSAGSGEQGDVRSLVATGTFCLNQSGNFAITDVSYS